MPIVLLLVAVAVVWGVKFGLGEFGAVVTPASEQEGSTSTGSQPSDAAPEDEEPVNTEPLAIASGGLLDPDVTDPNDVGEKPEAAPLAIDGDPTTFWYTFSYNSAVFGGNKSRTGYTVTLKEPATVRRVVLDTNNTGGRVEVRAVTESEPNGGAVLASAPFAKSVELELDPATEGTTYVLFITELPTNPEGKFRVELNEITVY